ncbi:glycosyl hydrolase [Pontimicrobium sp. SW4]|uniref:Glycosyl hydrolase n=1 Tax=Pontimicrobium sp. SW4 TaxID=3153519 RepID=A0AAU7BWU6_9FLAO
MKTIYKRSFLWLCLIGMIFTGNSQTINESTFSGLSFRNIGPALTSGRIADIAIHPENENVWYVAVGSGGVWKTINSGTTWKPIFDNQTSYSIGSIAIDPSNPHTIWVGTGENVGGRHVAFGDGIYVSHDDGMSWKNMGLKKSEHLSTIIVHPENSDIVWVASQGPLWSKGGERGVYKTTDGGKTWNRTLGDSEWVGATDIVIDHNNPDILYAASWQRHRTVAAYMGGGPGTGIHKSTDGGNTWTKLKKGLPGSNLGKIGLAISPFDSDVIYAVIETDRKKGGFYMSENKGESWVKQSNTVSGGTGPHYYQELYASPHHEGKLFLMNNTVLISDDHGKIFNRMNERNKHVDSHAMAFKASDPNYVLFGTDGGLYESFDLTNSWKYVSNLPITQFFKIAVDDSEPFYKVYGGTQDNGSQGGASRTVFADGIKNIDWWKTLGADGHQSATEPGNPNITYGEFQQGALWRIDQTTRETVFIQPQAREGDPFERFNWDAPILVSPHNPTRLYFASQRVWKSENRGDGWTPISSDLTLNQERITLPFYDDKQQSWDNAWDIGAMSNYNTITSLAESPKEEGLLYAGTDDGLIQVTENGGANWKKFALGNIKGVPSTAFVNDVRADLFDANVVYAALDNHKYGDYKPYLIKSTDKGKSWTLMNGDLPKTLLTWRLVQDHIKKDLLFAATEFGVYFTRNGGKNWMQLKSGIPTIAIRDITIQRRENDLVAASFGRGIFILDDITPLREFEDSMLSKEATLFPIKDALWYSPNSRVGSQGDNEYSAKNPPFGAIFTYYMSNKVKSLKDERKAREKTNTDFPSWDAIETENRQQGPHILLIIKDANGNVVNTVEGTNRKGFNRVNWSLTYPNKGGERLQSRGSGFGGGGVMATPGDYTLTIVKRVDGINTVLEGPKSFKVVPMYDGALKRKSYAEMSAFRNEAFAFQQDLTATNVALSRSIQTIDAMERALNKAEKPNDDLFKRINDARIVLLDIDKELNGDDTKGEIGERSNPRASEGNSLGWRASGNTYGPTDEHQAMLKRVKSQLEKVKAKLKTVLNNTLPEIERDLKATGAPWIEGQGMKND